MLWQRWQNEICRFGFFLFSSESCPSLSVDTVRSLQWQKRLFPSPSSLCKTTRVLTKTLQPQAWKRKLSFNFLACFILPSASSKGSALVYRWQVPYEHLCRSNGYHEVFVYVKRNCLSTGTFFGSSPANRRDLRGFAFLRWSVMHRPTQVKVPTQWSQILNQRLIMRVFFLIAGEIRMHFPLTFLPTGSKWGGITRVAEEGVL